MKLTTYIWIAAGLMPLRLMAQNPSPQNTNRKEILAAAADEDANTLMDQAAQLQKAKSYPDALALYSKASLQYNMKKEYTKYGDAVLKISNIHYLMKNYKNAEQSILNVALKAYSKASNNYGMMRCYQQLGNIYLGMQKPVESMWFFSQQGNIATQIHDEVSLTEALLSVVTVKIIRKQYALANKDLDMLGKRVVEKHQEAQFASLIANIKKIVSARMPK